jgi:riboflavin transporter FmnP
MQRASTVVAFRACFKSSLLAGPVAALLSLLGGTELPIASIAAVVGTPIGLLVGIVCGFPTLLVLTHFGLNTPVLGGVVGALLGAAVAVSLNYPQEVPLRALLALSGAGSLCGLVASRLCALTPPSSGRPSAAAHVER